MAFYRHPQAHSAANIAVVALIMILGAAAAVACAWATVAILRRADLAPGLLRPEVIPMAVLSACMAVVTAADLSWGLAIRSADGTLFHSDNGLLATPMPPSWIAGVLVLAAVHGRAGGRHGARGPRAAPAGRGPRRRGGRLTVRPRPHDRAGP